MAQYGRPNARMRLGMPRKPTPRMPVTGTKPPTYKPPTPGPGMMDLGASIRSAVQSMGEAVHNSVQATEAHLASIPSDLMHQFAPGGEADAIRGQIESAVSGITSRIQSMGGSVNVQNTGGQTRIGRS